MNPKARPTIFKPRDSSSRGLIDAFRSYPVQRKCCHGRTWAGRRRFVECRKAIAEDDNIGWPERTALIIAGEGNRVGPEIVRLIFMAEKVNRAEQIVQIQLPIGLDGCLKARGTPGDSPDQSADCAQE